MGRTQRREGRIGRTAQQEDSTAVGPDDRRLGSAGGRSASGACGQCPLRTTSGGGVNKARAAGGGAGCECEPPRPLSRSEPGPGRSAVPARPAAAVGARPSARPGGGGAAQERRVVSAGCAPRSTAPLSFVSCLRGRSGLGAQWCSLKMADGNEDARAEDLPGPAFENYEAMELACPAERSGHVAVSDGRHMFVWGGYKVSRAEWARSPPQLLLILESIFPPCLVDSGLLSYCHRSLECMSQPVPRTPSALLSLE